MGIMDVLGGALAPQQQNSPAAPPVAAPSVSEPTPQHNFASRILGAVADVLGGKDRTSYSVDQNGQTISTQTPNSRGQQIKNILSVGLRGLASAQQAQPGKGLAAGFEGEQNFEQNQDLLHRAQAQDQFKMQQEMQLHRAQIAEANMKAMSNAVALQKGLLDLNIERRKQSLIADALGLDNTDNSGTDVQANYLQGQSPIGDVAHLIDGANNGQPTYASGKPPAMITLSPEVAKQLSEDSGQRFVEGMQVPGSVVANITQQGAALRSVYNSVKRINPDVPDISKWDKGQRRAALLFAPELSQSNDTPSAAIANMANNKLVGGDVASLYAPRIAELYGGGDKLRAFEQSRGTEENATKDAAATAAKKEAENNAIFKSGLITNPNEAQGLAIKAQAILSDPNAKPEDKATAGQRLAQASGYLQHVQRFETNVAAGKKAAEQAITQGDPRAAADLLGQNLASLSEIKARGATPDFLTKVISLASKKYPGFSVQKQEADFNIAKSANNTQFFGSANSLVDPNGTIDQLQSQYNKLYHGKGSLPAFNNVKDFLNYQAGDPALAGFKQTAIGLADDYAKVMGGGQGSDSARNEVLKSITNAHNPEQMKAALDAARDAINSQRSARIGRNPVLRSMYGDSSASAPQGQPVYVNGKIAGYTTDGKTMTPVGQ